MKSIKETDQFGQRQGCNCNESHWSLPFLYSESCLQQKTRQSDHRKLFCPSCSTLSIRFVQIINKLTPPTDYKFCSESMQVLVFLPNCPQSPPSQITNDLMFYPQNKMYLRHLTSFLYPADHNHRLTCTLLGASTLGAYLAPIRMPMALPMQIQRWCLLHSLWPCRWHWSLFRIIIIYHCSHNQINYFLLPDPKLTHLLYLYPERQTNRRFLSLPTLIPTSQKLKFQVHILRHLRNLARNVVQAWQRLVNNAHEWLRLAIHCYWSPKMQMALHFCPDFVFNIPKKSWVRQVIMRGKTANG